MRKPHAKSWVKNLPETAAEAEALGRSPECTQEVIYGWLRAEGATLESVALRCLSDFADFGCTQTAGGLANSLSEWRTWFELRRTFRQSDQRTQDFEELLRTDFPETSPEKIAATGQLYFTMLASNAGNAEEFRAMEMLRLAKETAATNARIAEAKIRQKDAQIAQKDADLALSARRVVLLEENQAKAKAALEQVKTLGGITSETRKLIEDAMAGLSA